MTNLENFHINDETKDDAINSLLSLTVALRDTLLRVSEKEPLLVVEALEAGWDGDVAEFAEMSELILKGWADFLERRDLKV